MKYTVETTKTGFKEELIFRGKTYVREHTYYGGGRYGCSEEEFSVQLENSGYDDEDFLDGVDEVLDGFSGIDIVDAFKEMEE